MRVRARSRVPLLLLLVATTITTAVESTAAAPASYPRAPRVEDLVDVAGTDRCRDYALREGSVAGSDDDDYDYHNACTVNYVWMARNCARTCAQLRANLKYGYAAAAAGAASIIIDDDLADLEFCFKWTEAGHCTSNAPWMLEHCATTCTNILQIGCPRWAQRQDCITNPKFMHTVCHAACAAQHATDAAATTAQQPKTTTTTDDHNSHNEKEDLTYEEYSSINNANAAAAAATAAATTTTTATASEEYVSANTIQQQKKRKTTDDRITHHNSVAAATATATTVADTTAADATAAATTASEEYVSANTINIPANADGVLELTPELYEQLKYKNSAISTSTQAGAAAAAAAAVCDTTLDRESDARRNPQQSQQHTAAAVLASRSRFYVKIEAPSCHTHKAPSCAVFHENVWTPLARQYPAALFTTLHCHDYPALCTDLVSVKYAHGIDIVQGFQLAAVEFVDADDPRNQTTTRKRAVEIYGGAKEMAVSRALFSTMVEYNQPLLPYLFWEPPPHPPPREPAVPEDPHPTTTTTTTTPKRPRRRLAILVLATEGLVRPDIWSLFMESSRRNRDGMAADEFDIEVFVHNKNANTNLPKFCHIVPSLHTQWATVSLVRATIQLLQYATTYYYHNSNHQYHHPSQPNEEHNKEEDKDGVLPQFDKYILVSGDSIPLVDATTLMTKLFHAENNGAIAAMSSFDKHGKHEAETAHIFRYGVNIGDMNLGYGGTSSYNPHTKTFANAHIPKIPYGYQQIVKAKQWFVMTHQDALYYSHPQNDEVHNFELTLTPDEYYFPTLSQEYYVATTSTSTKPPPNPKEHDIPDPNGTDRVGTPGPFTQVGQPLMYDAWPDHLNGKNTLVLHHVDDYVHLTSGHLFARKISNNHELTTGIDLLWIKQQLQYKQQQQE